MIAFFATAALLLLAIGATRKRFQQATLYWGRAMADLDQSTQERGMQDEITPPLQTNLTIAYWIACLGLFVWGFFVLPWYIALLWPIFFGAGKRLLISGFPSPTSEHYRQKIVAILASRRDRFLRDGDDLKAEMADRYIARLRHDDLNPRR